MSGLRGRKGRVRNDIILINLNTKIKRVIMKLMERYGGMAIEGVSVETVGM